MRDGCQQQKAMKSELISSRYFDLQRYWARHGSVILQPYDMEVGVVRFIRLQPGHLA